MDLIGNITLILGFFPRMDEYEQQPSAHSLIITSLLVGEGLAYRFTTQQHIRVYIL